MMLAALQQTDLNWIRLLTRRNASLSDVRQFSSLPMKPDMNQITATVMDELMNENSLSSNAAHCN